MDGGGGAAQCMAWTVGARGWGGGGITIGELAPTWTRPRRSSYQAGCSVVASTRQRRHSSQENQFPVYESVLEAQIWTALFFRKVTSLYHIEDTIFVAVLMTSLLFQGFRHILGRCYYIYVYVLKPGGSCLFDTID